MTLRLSHALRDLLGFESIALQTICNYGTVNGLTEYTTKTATHPVTSAAPVLNQDGNSTLASLLELYEQKVAVLASSEVSELVNSAKKASRRFSAGWWKDHFRSQPHLKNGTVRDRGTKLRSSKGKFVVLTGSTGVLGSHLLHELLHDDSVLQIYCFNRAVDSKALQAQHSQDQGLPANFDPARVTFLTADLSSPNFGLGDSPILEEIAARVTHIIHNAWPVDFNLPLAAFNLTWTA